MGLNNSCRELSGSIESIRLYSNAIIQRLNARIVKDGSSNPGLKVSTYDVNIMGNSADRKLVTIKIIEDTRTNSGEIKIEHGSEHIEWQLSISKLCDCCIHNISKSLVFSVCARAAEPGDAIRTGQCPCYSFSDRKYHDYLSRKSKRQ